MRFGIMDMQIDALVPAGLSMENAAAHLAGFDHAGHVRGLAGRGFRTIELGGDLVLFFPNSYGESAIRELGAVKAEMGLSYTLHLPLWSAEPSTPLAPVREGTVRAIVDIIRATLPLEPEVYVLHATGALAAEFYQMPVPERAKALLMRIFQGHAAESIGAILRQTGISGRRLAVETIEFPFDLTLELADSLDLSLCLDTGHVLAGFPGQVDFWDVLERSLPRLAEVHLHDAPQRAPGAAPGYGTDHRPLGQGDLDVGRLLDRLAKAGFRGPLVFELMVDEALASLETLRRVRADAVSSE